MNCIEDMSSPRGWRQAVGGLHADLPAACAMAPAGAKPLATVDFGMQGAWKTRLGRVGPRGGRADRY
jgi:hypothetical protein